MLLLRKCLLLAIVAAVCLGVFVSTTSARLVTDDIASWTKEQYYDFLDKYNIPYKESDPSIVDTVKYYKDAAAANAEIFGAKIDHILSGLKIKLEQQKGISETNMETVIDTVQHRLRQLELQGQLSRDRVLQSLGSIERDLTKKRIVTEAQWREIYNDLASSFQENTAWYQRVFTRKSNDAAASLNRWLSGVQDRLQRSAELTEAQTDNVIRQLRRSMESTRDINKLGDKHWRHQFKHELKKQGDLTQDQIKHVMHSLETDVNGYKLFAMDYIGDKADQSQQWAGDMSQKIKDSGYDTMDYVNNWWAAICGKARSYLTPIMGDPADPYADNSAYATIRAAVGSVTDDWKASSAAAYRSKESAQHAAAQATDAAGASFESVKAQATDTAATWRDSFAHFWKDKENEAYRQMGYTEAQVNWIQSYLSKTFTDQKSLTKANVDHALDNIRNYLQQSQVQTQAQIQHSIDRLALLLETWRTKFYKQKANL
ncbi:hypothetical protein BDB00DRAFT_887461 [Zychaea mexicana]|uniref:uncharacterized protein n=1 Tax=Zychaea mexicana TaxID=64656 RepID=UPI0022FDC9F6|nr:uncharacterized protein BDB00DRAFT_887461 [Zychaea mexicana]KAI9488606.1 hypothetical protein BDB00DRAFT_887461 [Zychaea mexicana]